MLRIILYSALLFGLLACSGNNNNGGSGNVISTDAAPSISSVSDQSIEANSATDPISFTVSDDVTPAADLRVSATSDNQALVPAGGLSLGGSGADRTLVVTPQADQIGSAVITLQVEDELLQLTEESFVLTVVPAVTSFDSFVRSVFTADANSKPFEINALEFVQDAADFDDLLSP